MLSQSQPRRFCPDIRLNPDHYLWLSSCGTKQCIAPTKEGRRCRRSVDKNDMDTASNLLRTINRLPDGSEREEMICDFLLMNCCEKWHRDLLASDRVYGCLADLVDIYAQRFAARPIAPTMIDGRTLRSGTVTGTALETRRRFIRHTSYFANYKSDPRESVRGLILQDANREKYTQGTVYSFTWTKHPGFVKLGFTTRYVSQRMSEWQKCHPGALLSTTSYMQYPERMEGLIHLQLAKQRRKIPICESCSKCHIEWFEVSDRTVSHVINQWAELARREPLYGPGGYLSASWRRRVKSVEGEVTAQALLDLLNVEVTLQQVVTNITRDTRYSIPHVEQTARTTARAIRSIASAGPGSSGMAYPVGSDNNDRICPRPTTMEETNMLTAIPSNSRPIVGPSVEVSPQEDLMLTFFADFVSMLASIENSDSSNHQMSHHTASLLADPISTRPSHVTSVA